MMAKVMKVTFSIAAVGFSLFAFGTIVFGY